MLRCVDSFLTMSRGITTIPFNSENKDDKNRCMQHDEVFLDFYQTMKYSKRS